MSEGQKKLVVVFDIDDTLIDDRRSVIAAVTVLAVERLHLSQDQASKFAEIYMLHLEEKYSALKKTHPDLWGYIDVIHCGSAEIAACPIYSTGTVPQDHVDVRERLLVHARRMQFESLEEARQQLGLDALEAGIREVWQEIPERRQQTTVFIDGAAELLGVLLVMDGSSVGFMTNGLPDTQYPQVYRILEEVRRIKPALTGVIDRLLMEDSDTCADSALSPWICSGEIGVAKPRYEMLAVALSRLGMDSSRGHAVVVVGDNPQRDGLVSVNYNDHFELTGDDLVRYFRLVHPERPMPEDEALRAITTNFRTLLDMVVAMQGLNEVLVVGDTSSGIGLTLTL